jgi:hypothetical protein
MIISTADQILNVAFGSALIASNGLNIITDNPVANKVLVAFLLIVFPLLNMYNAVLFSVITNNFKINDVSLIPLIVYSLIINNRNKSSDVVSIEDRDNATKIAIAGLVLTIILNIVAVSSHMRRL